MSILKHHLIRSHQRSVRYIALSALLVSCARIDIATEVTDTGLNDTNASDTAEATQSTSDTGESGDLDTSISDTEQADTDQTSDTSEEADTSHADLGCAGEADRSCSTICGEGVERCVDGTWICDAPVDCECLVGTTEEEACGACGTRRRSCTSAQTWDDWTPCVECECSPPGRTDVRSCGNCGSEIRSCMDDLSWGAWSECTDEGCAPGTIQSCSDGSLSGTQTCSDLCMWSVCDTRCVNDVDCGSGALCIDEACVNSCSTTNNGTATCDQLCDMCGGDACVTARAEDGSPLDCSYIAGTTNRDIVCYCTGL